MLFAFTKGKYYEGNLVSVFNDNDYISIVSDQGVLTRFKMNKYSLEYIDDYIGENELYFHNFFVDIKKLRLEKLKKIN